MILFEQFRKSYGKTEIVNIPQLQLAHGIYWLRGENGAGKSTLMKSVAGLIPFQGNVTVYDNNIRKNRIAFTSMVNYAEAEPIFPGFLTGNDLIHFYTETKKVSQEQADKLCTQLGVSAFTGNPIATYSSGMAKKLSLVLGFIGTPKLILLDEPLITLDTNATAILQQLINEYYAQGVSFIISSHQEIAPQSLSATPLFLKNKTLYQA
jgi:ABC-2 type transport system ATP-binding protein